MAWPVDKYWGDTDVRCCISSWMENCTKFGQLILRKIIKIVATRCQILRLKCTKFDLGWGSAPYLAGELTALPPDPLAGFKGPTLSLIHI